MDTLLKSVGITSIYGVGIGVDLSPYYRSTMFLDVQESCLFRLCRALFAMFKQ